MKWNADKMAAYDISEILITHQTGDKSEKLIQVLRYVGPWLAWQDWRKLEKLNKVICEWCHSEDAAIGLFGLWQERTMSLCGAGTPMDILAHNVFNFEKPIPFLGSTSAYNFDHMAGKRAILYRSLLQLSDLEKQIVGNAFHTGSSVRDSPLPIKGGETDQWLLIDCSDLEKTDCIPPYYHLKFAVPKGLKIALGAADDPFHDPSGCIKEIYMAVGRAAALRLSGLIVYYNKPFILTEILESFVSALQEQKEGEFVSPLEILSLPLPGGSWRNENPLHERFRHVLASLRDQFVFGKLCNLKCLDLGLLATKETVEEFSLREVLYACPNLQVLEYGLRLAYEYLLNAEIPDNVYSPHNCLDYTSVNYFTDWKQISPHLIGIYGRGRYDFPRLKFSACLKSYSFSSLRILICDGPMKGKEVAGALTINCPALRFLQIDHSDFYRWCADWHELLKRLLVLILKVPHAEEIIQGPNLFRCFPEGCELRVLTMYVDCDSDELLWLGKRKLLNIIDVCLPKLLLLNVVFDKFYNGPLLVNAELRGNLKYVFNQKSVDLRFVYRDMDKSRWVTLP